jgi:cysteine-rich repeat protein
MRNASLTLALVLSLVGGVAPAAGVDLDGPWRLTVQPIIVSPFFCPAEIVQSGTALSLDAPSCLFPLSASGTIDPMTGAFSGSGTTGSAFCPTISISGNGTPESDAFFGSFTCSGGPFPFDGTFSGSRCGNGELDPGEQCDDGDVLDGDCCNYACELSPNRTPCGPSHDACVTGKCDGAGTCVLKPDKAGERCFGDSSECTDDVCDGAGACVHPNRPAGTQCFGDFDVCTDGACDGAGTCALTNNTAPCDDFNECTEGDTCAAGSCEPGGPAAAGKDCDADQDLCTLDACDGAGACAATGGCSDCCVGLGCAPGLATCKGPIEPGAKFWLRSPAFAGKQRLDLLWRRGETTTILDYGNPTVGTDYSVCVYQEVGGILDLVYRATAQAGGTCGDDACWKANGFRGFTYKNRAQTPSGIGIVKLRVGSSGRASVRVKGTGDGLNVPFFFAGDAGLATPVTVQVRTPDAACFEASFPTAYRNHSFEFRSKTGE